MFGVSELDVAGQVRVPLAQQAGEQNLSLGVRLRELDSLYPGQSGRARRDKTRDICKNFNLERVLKFEWVCTLLKGTIFIQVMMLVSLGGFIEGRCTFSIRMKEDGSVLCQPEAGKDLIFFF